MGYRAKALSKTYITLISLGSTFGATQSSQLHVSIHVGQRASYAFWRLMLLIAKNWLSDKTLRGKLCGRCPSLRSR